jgi:hypothetical protein
MYTFVSMTSRCISPEDLLESAFASQPSKRGIDLGFGDYELQRAIERFRFRRGIQNFACLVELCLIDSTMLVPDGCCC